MATNTDVLLSEESLAVIRQGGDPAVALFVDVLHRLQAVEQQVAKNSRNSSKPPSSDGLTKPPLRPMPQSLRKKSGKKPGGQKGHPGTTLVQVETPDQTVVHRPDVCDGCKSDLHDATVVSVSHRQVFEMPVPKVVVTDNQIVTVRCPCCGEEVQAAVPQGAEKPAQYGPYLLGFGTYLHTMHVLPYARCAQVVREVTGAPFSPGSLAHALRTAYHRLDGFEKDLESALATAPVKHVDETGFRVAGKLQWLHVRSTEHLCRVFHHERRGGEATTDLKDYTGILVSDCWSAYLRLNCSHLLCGAHLLRELKFVHEVEGQAWAGYLSAMFENAVSACHKARDRGSRKLWNAREHRGHIAFWIGEGVKANPPPPKGTPKSKARRLLERLIQWESGYVRFLSDLSLPFTNNLAERDIRMFKVKGKVSGCFRTGLGADLFCRLRSYAATCERQGMKVLDCFRSVFAGKILMPALQHAE